MPDTPEEIPTLADTVFLLDHMNSTPVTAALIRRWTLTDPVLSKVKAHMMRGWKYSSSAKSCPYFIRKSELSVESGCILCSHRVIVPRKGQATVLDLLHESYQGIDRNEATSLRIINKQIEENV